MRLAPTLAILLVPLGARAEDGGPTSAPVREGASAIVGGTNAPDGKWPDVTAVLFGGMQGCTGTLIAPTVVITAGHCNDSQLTSVLVGTSSLARPGDGETIDVAARIEFPNSQETADITLLVLARASKFAPRKIATGWARLDIKNGARAQIVGYGAIDAEGRDFKDELQEATTTITDSDCVERVGCNASVAPGGELGAGGMGIDTCVGDSGGPLYLSTSYGDFLAGVTSRAYDDASLPCSEGGIYARPDTVFAQLEQMAGVPLARGPGPTFDPMIAASAGDAVETRIVPNDPVGESHAFTIVTPPSRGMAKVRGDGVLRVCTDPVAPANSDEVVVVTVADEANPARKLEVTIPIAIGNGVPATAPCDVDAFVLEEDGGGCCDSGRGGRTSALLTMLVLGLLVRRRRQP